MLTTSTKYISAVEDIIAQTHEVDGDELHIRQYFPCLGVIPPDHNVRCPPGLQLSDIHFKVEDRALKAYLDKFEGKRKKIAQNLQSIDCQVEWPKDENGPLTLKCTVNAKAFFV